MTALGELLLLPIFVDIVPRYAETRLLGRLPINTASRPRRPAVSARRDADDARRVFAQDPSRYLEYDNSFTRSIRLGLRGRGTNE